MTRLQQSALVLRRRALRSTAVARRRAEDAEIARDEALDEVYALRAALREAMP